MAYTWHQSTSRNWERQLDADHGDVVIELKFGTNSIRALNDAVVQVATVLSRRPKTHGYIVFVNSSLTQRRLEEEWQKLTSIFHQELVHRMAICLYEQGKIQSVPEILDNRSLQLITEAVEENEQIVSASRVSRSSDAFLDIFRVLLIHWLRHSGPLTSKEISTEAGFSYPTVARSLDQLEPCLMRYSDRRVELRRFPKDAWFKLVAQKDKIRETQYFADRSGKPRSIDALRMRLLEMSCENTALGGVLGAKHYVPGLDLVGNMRLDLLMHRPKSRDVTNLVRKLDPALKPAQPGEKPSVVISFIYRPQSFFEWDNNSKTYWADQVECLLDLHDARLEAQALEFLERLTPTN